jgi:hypothetical protein
MAESHTVAAEVIQAIVPDEIMDSAVVIRLPTEQQTDLARAQPETEVSIEEGTLSRIAPVEHERNVAEQLGKNSAAGASQPLETGRTSIPHGGDPEQGIAPPATVGVERRSSESISHLGSKLIHGAASSTLMPPDQTTPSSSGRRLSFKAATRKVQTLQVGCSTNCS